MSKTVFFNIPATGHINPSLPVMAELVRRGEEVIYVNMENTRAQIEHTGVRFLPYPDLPQLAELVNQASGGNLADNALALIGIAEQILPFVFDTLQREKPDYVMHDSLASWGKQAAEVLKLPTIASVVTFALLPGAPPPLPMSMLLPMMGMIAGGILPRMPDYWRLARRMKEKFGVKGVGLTGALMNLADMNIVFTSREFQPGSEKMGAAFKFVGPSISSARVDGVEFPFDQLTRHPVIYISLGTINNTNMDFYRNCFAAFADYPAQFILSVGKKTDIAALGQIPPNFIVRNFVPQLDVLQKADLFITHGGLNSVSEGLYYGLPLVVVPQQIEQLFVALQVAKHGAGLALGVRPPIGIVTANELRMAVDTVLGSVASYKQAAVRLGDSFRAAGGYMRAADEIIAFSQRTNHA
jgi:MGT family glycosyltransferase